MAVNDLKHELQNQVHKKQILDQKCQSPGERHQGEICPAEPG